jgi:hypothetical protein
MPPEKVSSAKAKIERAEKHIAELEDELLRFGNIDPYKFGPQRDPNTRELLYRMIEVAPPPRTIAPIAADALQNLRSALDHLISAFVPSPNSFTGFPIFNPAKTDNSYLGRKINGISPAGRQIVEALKPYKGGNDVLWRLHELNRIDKHRTLVTVASSLGVLNINKHNAFLKHGSAMLIRREGQHFRVSIAQDVYVRPKFEICPIKAGDVILVDPPDSEPDKDIDFGFFVSFYEPEIPETHPVSETLHDARNLVAQIVSMFAALP